jgi:hypothetical protein
MVFADNEAWLRLNPKQGHTDTEGEVVKDNGRSYTGQTTLVVSRGGGVAAPMKVGT